MPAQDPDVPRVIPSFGGMVVVVVRVLTVPVVYCWMAECRVADSICGRAWGELHLITRSTLIILFGALTAVALGCSRNDTGSSPLLDIRESRSPAGPGSGEPNLSVTPDGRVLLSWVQKEGSRHSLRFSARVGNRWSDPITITSGENWFVDETDVPSVIALDERSLSAHWLVRSGRNRRAHDVCIAFSSDGGASWGEAVVPHRDSTKTEHGFVSMLPWGGDRLLAVWLDGRNFSAAAHSQRRVAATSNAPARLGRAAAASKAAPGHERSAATSQTAGGKKGPSAASNEMMLRFAVLGRNGRQYDEGTLDERVCDCCQTAAVLTPNGAVVAYRDRSDEEVRDIALRRYENGRWSEPQVVSADGWKLVGCPVSGPALAAMGQRLAVAWFTAAYTAPHVKVIFSEDEGLTFGLPVVVDDGAPIGRVDVVLLEDGSALVCWLESSDDGATIRVRRVWKDGSVGRSQRVAPRDAGGASGVPRMARAGDEIHFAWTQPGDPPVVHTAVAKVQP
jgi:hypothetical protein